MHNPLRSKIVLPGNDAFSALRNGGFLRQKPKYNPTHYYPLNGDGKDLSGYGLDLSLTNVTFADSDKSYNRQHGVFGAAGSRGTATGAIPSGSNTFSIVGGLYFGTQDENYGVICRQDDGGGGFSKFVFSEYHPGGSLKCGGYNQGYLNLIPATTATPGTWYHFAYVMDGGVGYHYAYVNGELNESAYHGATSTTTTSFSVGNTSVGGNGITGDILELKLFDGQVLDQNSIRNYYKEFLTLLH